MSWILWTLILIGIFVLGFLCGGTYVMLAWAKRDAADDDAYADIVRSIRGGP